MIRKLNTSLFCCDITELIAVAIGKTTSSFDTEIPPGRKNTCCLIVVDISQKGNKECNTHAKIASYIERKIPRLKVPNQGLQESDPSLPDGNCTVGSLRESRCTNGLW